MRIAKINTIAYDPDSKTLSFTGLNRFSRSRQGSVFIDDEVKFIETIHQLLADSNKSSVDFAAKLRSGPEKKGKKNSADKAGKSRKNEGVTDEIPQE